MKGNDAKNNLDIKRISINTLRPKRPERPILCMQSSRLFGRSQFITRETCKKKKKGEKKRGQKEKKKNHGLASCENMRGDTQKDYH